MSFLRVAVISPKLYLADVGKNVEVISQLIHANRDAAVLLFPELSLTGYTMGDLFMQEALHKAVLRGIERLKEVVRESIVIVGAPLWYQNRLYNCAVVMQKGKILGIVPKSYLPNYREFYELRWFHSGKNIKDANLLDAPFGTDLLFEDDDLLFGVEICEDLWTLKPPSFDMAAAGANLICNLSASDEVVGKHTYRKDLVLSQSARCICAYAYASSGVGESSMDLCYSGATMIAENGALLAEGERFGLENQITKADIDLQKLRYLRASETSFAQSEVPSYRIVKTASLKRVQVPNRYYDPTPFVPKHKEQKHARAKEIFAIQSHALARRVQHVGMAKMVIGVSGGLDSTLALLVCNEVCKLLERPKSDIVAISMPGFGTTNATRSDAKELARLIGADFQEIDITKAVKQHLKDIDHANQDVVFENAQARYRTMLLMDMANKVGGLVVGTSDLSEIALGFSTYNGDHMAMYHVNAGVPKTLVRYIIEWVAANEKDFAPVLQRIIKRPVSPELLPPSDGEIAQKTEEIIGPYELHDFFLYHFIKYGASPKKLLLLATLAFKEKYGKDEIKKWLRVFIKRFFANQFKRDAMPDGVKVGTIALSPRGDWRMPSDAQAKVWLEELEDGSSD